MKISVWTTDGPVKVSTLVVIGRFAIHGSVGKWGKSTTMKADIRHGYTVTHIASGWSVRSGIAGQKCACELARAADAVKEWDLLDPAKIKPLKNSRYCTKRSIPKALNQKMSAVILKWMLSKCKHTTAKRKVKP